MARLFSTRTLVLGGLAAAAAAVAIKNRGGVRGLLGSGQPAPAPAPSEAPWGTAANAPGPAPAPAVANADAPGPPANTATPVPAPDPQVHEPEGGIDEQAEEAAAAAEAANIGGGPVDYPDPELGEIADEATAPLVEAGEGESEGQEVAEFELEDNAEPAAGDPLEGGRQIEDVIEQQDQPSAGEVPAADQAALDEPEPEDALPGAATPAEPADAQLEMPDAPAPTPDDRVDDTFAPPVPTDRLDDELAPPPPPPGTPEADAGDTLAAGTFDEGAPTTGGSLSGTAGGETPAAEKSANVWREGENEGEGAEKDDDDGPEWQTWSGRAVDQ